MQIVSFGNNFREMSDYMYFQAKHKKNMINLSSAAFSQKLVKVIHWTNTNDLFINFNHKTDVYLYT